MIVHVIDVFNTPRSTVPLEQQTPLCRHPDRPNGVRGTLWIVIKPMKSRTARDFTDMLNGIEFSKQCRQTFGVSWTYAMDFLFGGKGF